MQEETFQFQQLQVIEYSHRKILKPLQRKLQSKVQHPDTLYFPQEANLECNVISNFSKRGNNFSIEEEYKPQIIQNPLVNELPNFTKLHYQLNHTIQKQPEKTYNQIEMIQNDSQNKNNSVKNIYNDCYSSKEDSFDEDYRLIKVDDLDYLQNLQNQIIENKTKEQGHQKQIPKQICHEITKGIHKIKSKK